ncbi:hypothetical protein HGM15179_017563 [Zosterops borbonicus]|uniref:Uncharacterized protein n=1 Tax=Zosterops borbonicus TaxID=364589 RepID=A0A8K1LD71_9PASS|nr:hypothetical protein HGM15179_017563 [Zosterops borbonicus]
MSVQDKEQKDKKFSRELVHQTAVIKISYSTPQGKGKVVKVPSLVHGSVKPFCLERVLQNEAGDQEETRDSECCQQTKCLMDKSAGSQLASIPKLKLTWPVHSSADVPPPKIRQKPHCINNSQNVSIYKAELIDEINPSRAAGSPILEPFTMTSPPTEVWLQYLQAVWVKMTTLKGFPRVKMDMKTWLSS